MKPSSHSLLSPYGILRAVNMLLTVVVLALSLYSIDRFFDIQEMGSTQMDLTPVVVLFLCLSAIDGIQLVLLNKRSGKDVLRFAIRILACLLCAAFLEFSRHNSLFLARGTSGPPGAFSFYHVSRLYAIAQMADHILRIHPDGSHQNLSLNALAILFYGMFLVHTQFLALLFLITLQSLYHIATASFMNIDRLLLWKILRRTHAAEILFSSLLMILTVSVILPHFEKEIGSFSDALWYCFAIVTTIGFGDYSAVSPIGRILSVVLGIYGIIVVSLITSIIVNFYMETRSTEDKDDTDILDYPEFPQDHPDTTHKGPEDNPGF